MARLRNYFLTGLVVAAPLSITIYITWSFINFVDDSVKPWMPALYNPDTYLPFAVPGVGLLVALVGLTLIGALTANLFGRSLIELGEQILGRTPVVRNLYRALKQIFETVISQSSSSFQEVGLIEYPRLGLYAIVFVSTDTKGEVKHRTGVAGDDMISVFLPTTPNPTSGFLLFLPRKDMISLDMSVEEAAKLVISAGLVTPEYDGKKIAGNAEVIENKTVSDPE
ncbi:MAG: hypothetical protein C0605_05845 [Hyphomicrobiales bacterium]|nr:MAG: hypothetical protein C0605_05845 [Hyphomicrobiales bacterium]